MPTELSNLSHIDLFRVLVYLWACVDKASLETTQIGKSRILCVIVCLVYELVELSLQDIFSPNFLAEIELWHWTSASGSRIGGQSAPLTVPGILISRVATRWPLHNWARARVLALGTGLRGRRSSSRCLRTTWSRSQLRLSHSFLRSASISFFLLAVQYVHRVRIESRLALRGGHTRATLFRDLCSCFCIWKACRLIFSFDVGRWCTLPKLLFHSRLILVCLITKAKTNWCLLAFFGRLFWY